MSAASSGFFARLDASLRSSFGTVVFGMSDGTVSIFTTIIDHSAPASHPAQPKTPLALASLSRELAVNDPQRPVETATTDGRRGTLADRNVELLVRKPF